MIVLPPSVVETVPLLSELVMVQFSPLTDLRVPFAMIAQACPPDPEIVSVDPSNVGIGSVFVRTNMLPSATVIGEGWPENGVYPLCGQPGRTISAQTGKIRRAYGGPPPVFGYCVLRMYFLLSLISGNHPQKGTPEPLQIGPGMVRLKSQTAPLARHYFQLPLGG
jgi:hypothetical protein